MSDLQNQQMWFVYKRINVTYIFRANRYFNIHIYLKTGHCHVHVIYMIPTMVIVRKCCLSRLSS